MTNKEAIARIREHKIIHKMNEPRAIYISEALDMGIKALKNQKTGHWIELGYTGNDNYDFKCSECNHSDIHSKIVKVPYCWYCGAKMEGENNGNS